jgi:hypothetical protein
MDAPCCSSIHQNGLQIHKVSQNRIITKKHSWSADKKWSSTLANTSRVCDRYIRVHSTQKTVHSTRYTVYRTQHKVHSTQKTVQGTPYTENGTWYTLIPQHTARFETEHVLSYSRNHPHCVEHSGPLPCSQVPAT